MRLYTGPHHDVCHHLNANGAYEWWYVDALSPHADDPWGVVVILFRGMPMSPDYLDAQDMGAAHPTDHCGMAVSVYHGTRRIAFAFRTFSAEEWDVPGHVIHVDTAHADVPQSIEVRVAMSESPMSSTPDAASVDDHGWVLVAPRIKADVEVSIRESGMLMASASWQGLAYRDHNFGPLPLQRDFGDWYWGRVHADDQTLVFLAAPNAQQPFLACGQVSADGTTWLPWTNVRFVPEQRRLSMMGLWSGRRTRIIGCDAAGTEHVLECHHRWIMENGPFYQRYLSEWTLDGKGLGRGTSEYMDAARLGQAWIRPFLRLPHLRVLHATDHR